MARARGRRKRGSLPRAREYTADQASAAPAGPSPTAIIGGHGKVALGLSRVLTRQATRSVR